MSEPANHDTKAKALDLPKGYMRLIWSFNSGSANHEIEFHLKPSELKRTAEELSQRMAVPAFDQILQIIEKYGMP